MQSPYASLPDHEWTKLDKEWTKTGQRLDKEWTKSGRRLNKERTQTGQRVDADWTKSGQRLDKEWRQNEISTLVGRSLSGDARALPLEKGPDHSESNTLIFRARLAIENVPGISGSDISIIANPGRSINFIMQ